MNHTHVTELRKRRDELKTQTQELSVQLCPYEVGDEIIVTQRGTPPSIYRGIIREIGASELWWYIAIHEPGHKDRRQNWAHFWECHLGPMQTKIELVKPTSDLFGDSETVAEIERLRRKAYELLGKGEVEAGHDAWRESDILLRDVTDHYEKDRLLCEWPAFMDALDQAEKPQEVEE